MLGQRGFVEVRTRRVGGPTTAPCTDRVQLWTVRVDQLALQHPSMYPMAGLARSLSTVTEQVWLEVSDHVVVSSQFSWSDSNTGSTLQSNWPNLVLDFPRLWSAKPWFVDGSPDLFEFLWRRVCFYRSVPHPRAAEYADDLLSHGEDDNQSGVTLP